MDQAGPGRETSMMRWTGPGHGPASRNSMGWAAAHRLKTSKWMSRAGLRPIISKFDGPGRATAHEMWVPYGPLSAAHEATHVF